jgi:hypothetical protein
MKKRLSLVIVAVAFFSNFIKAQDFLLGDSSITIGYGWNSTFYRDTTNPGPTTGVGCSSAKVTKVVVTGWGSFGFQKLPTTIDWTKYDRIEMLVYPELAATFKEQVVYKGWITAATSTSFLDKKVTGTALTSNQWQVVTIKLDGPLYNTDSSKIYSSLNDVDLMMNTIQLYLGCDHTILDIGTITLKEKAASNIDDVLNSTFTISPNPTSSSIKVSYKDIENAKISIKSITGIEVVSVKAENNETTIDVSGLSAGMYIVSIITPQGIQSEKLSIK